MGHFDEFNLTIKKTNEFPLTYEALIPGDCNFFQDVRRYQSVSAHLDVRVINVDGCISLDPDMQHIPIGKLTSIEKKEFIDYLKIRLARGDNIGSTWAFFRPRDKKPIIAHGANIVHTDAAIGQENARKLLATLQRSKISSHIQKRFLTKLVLVTCIAAAIFAGYRYGYQANRFSLTSLKTYLKSPEMEFYKTVFPQVYEWKADPQPNQPLTRKIADELLKPEYVSGLLSTMNKDFYRSKDTRDSNPGNRLILYTYFNYNSAVTKTMERHRDKLEGTEFQRLSKIYSCRQSGYSSNIFYFKVGDLDLKHAEISRFLVKNMISYTDYTKLRDANAFSELLEKDSVSYKMKSFLEDVYTFTPLRIQKPLKGVEWFLLTQKDKTGKLEFVAFFKKDKSTLVPKRIGDLLLKNKKRKNISWYGINETKAAKLKLSGDSLTYFSKATGQALKLSVIKQKITELALKPTAGFLPVTVHRELLMGDTKGKYAVQCYDPLTSLVLSNLITKSSFERDNKVSLKRDPIQVNTTLVQLSKDDGFSVQSINIPPGKTGIIKLFEPVESFKASFENGQTATFEKATVNLFNPFTFMVVNDSITFSFKHDITDMEIDMGNKLLKIVKTNDGNHHIMEID